MIKLRKEKGQAFSTFQLLIAAVVALALLAVLLPLLKSPNIGNSATKLTQDLLKSQQQNIGALRYTQKVTMKANDTMAVSGLTQNTGIDVDQVSIVVPEELSSSFTVANNKVLKYSKTSKGTYIIGVLCDNQDAFDASVGNYSTEIPSSASVRNNSRSLVFVCPSGKIGFVC